MKKTMLASWSSVVPRTHIQGYAGFREYRNPPRREDAMRGRMNMYPMLEPPDPAPVAPIMTLPLPMAAMTRPL